MHSHMHSISCSLFETLGGFWDASLSAFCFQFPYLLVCDSFSPATHNLSQDGTENHCHVNHAPWETLVRPLLFADGCYLFSSPDHSIFIFISNWRLDISTYMWHSHPELKMCPDLNSFPVFHCSLPPHPQVNEARKLGINFDFSHSLASNQLQSISQFSYLNFTALHYSCIVLSQTFGTPYLGHYN